MPIVHTSPAFSLPTTFSTTSQVKNSTTKSKNEERPKKNLTKLSNHIISEDLVYGARTYSKIADKGASVAKKFLSLLSSIYEATSRYKSPIYDAVEKVMRTLQRDHDIDATERKKIKLAALGSADLDPHHETLHGTISMSEVNSASHKKSWTESTLHKFRVFRLNTLMRTTNTDKTGQKSSRPFLSRALSRARYSTTPTVTMTGMSGFLWKPTSDSDGKLAILLPSSLTGLISSVMLVEPSYGKVIEVGRFAGVGNGDRAHFRFSKEGGAYPPGTLVTITLDDGSTKTLTIDNTKARVESRG